MMSRSQKALLASWLLLGSASVYAAQSATLQVAGKISPGACSINFTTTEGNIKYDNVDPADLDPISSTALPQASMDYTIGCGSAIKVTTLWTDNKADSKGGINTFGLGKQGEANIGYYTVSSSGRVDSDGDDLITVAKDGGTGDGGWNEADASVPLTIAGRYMSYAEPGAVKDPVARQNYKGTFIVRPFINGTNTLNMGAELKLDGDSTVVLSYP